MKGFPAALIAIALFVGAGYCQEGFPPPTEDNSRTFALKLTDELIEDLKRNPEGLISIIPPENRGQISRVRVYYEGSGNPAQPLGSFNTPFGGSERVASSRPPSLTEPPPQEGRSILDQLPDPSQIGNSGTGFGDDNFMGPRQNTGSSQGSGMVPFNGSANPISATSGSSFAAPNSNPDFSGSPSFPVGGQGTASDPLARQREQWKQEADRLAAERKAEQEQLRQIDEIVEQRMRLEREKMMRELQSSQQAHLQNQTLYTSSIGAPPTNSPFTSPTLSGSGQTLAPYRPPATGFEPARSVTQVALTPKPSDGAADPGLILPPEMDRAGAASSDQKTDQQQARLIADSKTNGALLLMLLCSVALNIYLGWIARGFYVRYADLADELRETFSATV